jgi:two-component system response regulator DevR
VASRYWIRSHQSSTARVDVGQQDDGQKKSSRDALSPQEQRILSLVVEGKTNKEIAKSLGLSDKTVKNYLSNAFEKMNVGRRSHAAAIYERDRTWRKLAE